jgi:hypothetical protein
MAETEGRVARIREERKKRGECIQCGKPAMALSLRCQKCSDRLNLLRRETQVARKLAAMEHYGKDEKAVCCWDGCGINDLDMLTLDHVANNGEVHRREYSKTGRGGGTALYLMLERQDYPVGYQTLCCNHNLKKHMLAIRTKR